MHRWLILGVTPVAAYIAFEAFRIFPLYRATQQLAKKAAPFTRAAGANSILVLGDSTAVGIGADRPEDSVIGLIAKGLPGSSVENYAQSGARIDDPSQQLSKALRDRYDLAFVQVGANDLIRFRSATNAAESLLPILIRLKDRAQRVILVMAGNVGGAPFFPWVLRPIYHRRSLAYHAALEDIAQRSGVIYVKLYLPPEKDPFSLQPEQFLASDRLHPSSAGYALWFKRIAPAL